MKARVSRNVGSNGANEWRADDPQPAKHHPVIVYARSFLIADVEFVLGGQNKHDGWALGEVISAADMGSNKGPKFAITDPVLTSLDNGMIEELPEEGWIPFRFERGTGFVIDGPTGPRVLAGAGRVLVGPKFASLRDPAF